MMNLHEPVLLNEVIEELNIESGKRYIDATLGAGGYSKAIYKAGGEVLGIDTDNSMLSIARENLKDTGVKLAHGNFRDITKIAKQNEFSQVDGIVFDLGVSNVHFMDEKRGFSFRNPEAQLDMRLDESSQGLKASDLLNALREDQLTEILGRGLARGVIEYRKEKKFEKVGDFLSLFPERKYFDKVHPATKAFMALRVAVNTELDSLKEALPVAYDLLKKGGRLVVVSFNSDEDRIVKEFMKKSEFIRPSDEELERNPKSRSAILRTMIKKI
jgi:16S rRNA (cytosine1402-N4)-methyltransferase